jgi:hypothetical protein
VIFEISKISICGVGVEPQGRCRGQSTRLVALYRHAEFGEFRGKFKDIAGRETGLKVARVVICRKLNKLSGAQFKRR